ncbi:hypothetical protein WMY93_024451 [Mugilogobius chulae]|uniref:B box-type domain-containing protein n=1 Tax=Mugilogobius chulae TaxID=88201 RepID=A0AAW0NC84_9GOBI
MKLLQLREKHTSLFGHGYLCGHSNHLEPHLTVPRLQKHQLMEPMENLEQRMCLKHDKPLELFCCTDQFCICMVCTVLEHKSHDILPLKDEFEKQKVSLNQITTENRGMIEERQEKMNNVRQCLDISLSCAQREMNNGVVFFDAVLDVVQESMAQFRNDILKKQKATEKQADGLISELEQEIGQLEHREVKMGQLACSDDYLHALQSFNSLKITPNLKDWNQVSYRPTSFSGSVENAVVKLEHHYGAEETAESTRGVKETTTVKSAPQIVGVFVDYEQGLVSFYDVETAEHLYSFTNCAFSGKLYAFFSPGNRRSPLIINPVQKV